ncbi:protein of unknown function [Bradyrhizobium vignae]|uniref:Uncharacterized protein n=1 Tax=Bradyrhizobium vignae TaxID=1549949 RepID=A0A2U3Q9H4_9BRAD|nr:protein of unknown function [Bradyrhizobium vignae]
MVFCEDGFRLPASRTGHPRYGSCRTARVTSWIRRNSLQLIEARLVVAAPHLSAIYLLSRLEAHAPGRFSGHQRRTVQRLVKNWRSKAARQLISGTEITPSFQPSCLSL